MKTFDIIIRYNGRAVIRTRATDSDAAQRQVCAAEGCPRSAIYAWKLIQETKPTPEATD